MNNTPQQYLNEARSCLESSNYAAAQAYALVGLLGLAVDLRDPLPQG